MSWWKAVQRRLSGYRQRAQHADGACSSGASCRVCNHGRGAERDEGACSGGAYRVVGRRGQCLKQQSLATELIERLQLRGLKKRSAEAELVDRLQLRSLE